MLQAPAVDAPGVLDWIMSRHVQEYLDVAGRPLGEGRAVAIRDVPTEMQPCPYGGSRHHHDKPMNVSALRHIVPVWGPILTMLSWLSQRYQARQRKEVTTCTDLSLVTSAGVFLADFLVQRRHHPLRSGEIPVLISGLHKVCLGFQTATFLGSLRERFAEAPPASLPDAAGFYAEVEAQGLLIGEAEVCSGPPAMIREAYDAMVGRRPPAREDLPADCARLEIAWEQLDSFTEHAADTWNELVLYAVEMPHFLPRLVDARLPADVQDRLNACLKRAGEQLLAGQTGLLVDFARSAREFGGPDDAAPPPDPGPPVAPPGDTPGSLADVVLAWLSAESGADMQAHEQAVAGALRPRLEAYDAYEAGVLARLNGYVSGMMEALELSQSGTALTASALSDLCGQTLRDWPGAGRGEGGAQ